MSLAPGGFLRGLRALATGDIDFVVGVGGTNFYARLARSAWEGWIVAQLCIRYELRLLTTHADFARIAQQEPLERWTP